MSYFEEELGFQNGKSTYICPVELKVFFGVIETVMVTPVAPMIVLLGVIEADVRLSG